MCVLHHGNARVRSVTLRWLFVRFAPLLADRDCRPYMDMLEDSLVSLFALARAKDTAYFRALFEDCCMLLSGMSPSLILHTHLWSLGNSLLKIRSSLYSLSLMFDLVNCRFHTATRSVLRKRERVLSAGPLRTWGRNSRC